MVRRTHSPNVQNVPQHEKISKRVELLNRVEEASKDLVAEVCKQYEGVKDTHDEIRVDEVNMSSPNEHGERKLIVNFRNKKGRVFTCSQWLNGSCLNQRPTYEPMPMPFEKVVLEDMFIDIYRDTVRYEDIYLKAVREKENGIISCQNAILK